MKRFLFYSSLTALVLVVVVITIGLGVKDKSGIQFAFDRLIQLMDIAVIGTCPFLVYYAYQWNRFLNTGFLALILILFLTNVVMVTLGVKVDLLFLYSFDVYVLISYTLFLFRNWKNFFKKDLI